MATPASRRAFTLVELLVSIAILALTLTMVGLIFSMSTKATGLAQANNDNLNNLRSLVTQLQQDLKGLRKDAFVGLCYNYLDLQNQKRPVDADAPGVFANTRADWIVFFANGDFETVRQRWTALTSPPRLSDSVGSPIPSGTARIQYGMIGTHRDFVDALRTERPSPPLAKTELGRLAKLSVATDFASTTTNNDPPNLSAANFPSFTDGSAASVAYPDRLWDKNGDVYENWEYEYWTVRDWTDRSRVGSLAGPVDSVFQFWRDVLIGKIGSGATARNNYWLGLAYLDPDVSRCDHVRMLRGCVGFKVQRWAETDPVNPSNSNWVPRWWPEDDDPATARNYVNAGSNPRKDAFVPGTRIWECFNAPADAVDTRLDAPAGWTGEPSTGYLNGRIDDWPHAETSADPWPWITRDRSYSHPTDAARTYWPRAIKASFPKALKFTITIVDENRRMRSNLPAAPVAGRIDGAQDFTLVVPLE